ncbi:hypothetical protein BC628DRAFT_1494924 [Trametes gibbosa]|nr:hypothetical protein BC628DRAFT_1494924 [Trametes gibbosa]
MAAARPKLAVIPSGADRAWGTANSAASASSSFLDLQTSSIVSSAAGQSTAAASKNKATAVPQPNVKKMRRRVALLSGVHLNLPSSPVVGPSPPGSSREMAWTFTAEWDSTQDEIVFSEVDSASGSSASSYSSSSSLRFVASPIPFDVEEDEIFDFDVQGAPPVAPSPSFSDMLGSSSCSSPSSPSSPSALASPFSPSMSALSEIFDFYMHTPHTLSFSHHERNDSVSTAPSSPVGPPSPAEPSPPSYSDSRFDPPVISVTFYQEPENPARSSLAAADVGGMSGFSLSAVDTDSHGAAARISTKPRMLPPAPSASRVARRPLPPVPVRVTSMDVSAARQGVQQSSVWDDTCCNTQRASKTRTTPSRSQGVRATPSSYGPPVPGTLHARAPSLGQMQAQRTAEGQRKGAVGKHIRSISAVLSGGLHRSHH